ncbi:3-hydroxyisobutyrate dehydrogenase [Dongia deserti]|uniref:3-hydroxyisobutyrate dehydrogenase n=1 Tax=Dongia deserti TaxID=2268030 RepID=UPI000E655B45|nr:3-hydroxyisobutyrate dehydrogenase [Dongia deserti]
MPSIGFIGVGHMGAPMARNLLKAGHPVTIFDPDVENAQAMVNAGAKQAASLVELASASDVVISMLPSGRELRVAYLDNDGVVAHAKAGALLIDCSTTDVDSARAVGDAAKKRSLPFLDSPVSGGVAGAEAGTLTFMTGGEDGAVQAARPILMAMGKNVVHTGSNGSGQAAKICNNLILGISMIGVCEAFVLAEQLGLSPEKLFAVSSTSSGQCWSLTSYCPVPGPVPAAPSNRDYQPGFAAKMMLKDLRLATDAAEKHNKAIELGGLAKQLYERFVQDGSGDLDFSAIIQAIRQR